MPSLSNDIIVLGIIEAGILQGVPKNSDYLSTGHRGHQKWAKDKSRGTFEKCQAQGYA